MWQDGAVRQAVPADGRVVGVRGAVLRRGRSRLRVDSDRPAERPSGPPGVPAVGGIPQEGAAVARRKDPSAASVRAQ